MTAGLCGLCGHWHEGPCLAVVAGDAGGVKRCGCGRHGNETKEAE